MPEPLVSIIMPAYNAEKYLAGSIRSVLDQTYRHWELIIVDDGSTDRTSEIAQSFSLIAPRIKCIYQPNKKVAGAKNTGLKKSRGDFIAFIGSDDLWLPEKLELQVRRMAETGADILFSDGFRFQDDGCMSEAQTFSTLRGRFCGDEMFELLLISNRIPDLSVLVRREVLRKTGFFNEASDYYRGCEDYEFWLRAARDGAVFYGMEEKLVRYRLHEDSMTAKRAEIVKIEIATIKNYMSQGHVQSKAVRKRFRDSYRVLVSAFVEENKIAEAKACLKEQSRWDKFGIVTSIQRIIIKMAPGKYNAISARLYAFGSKVSKYRATSRPRRVA